MSALLRKQFENQYGVELLPRSFSDTRLGEIMEWKGLFSPMLDYKSYTIADVLNLPPEKSKELNSKLGNCCFIDASFPALEIRDDFGNDSDLQIPSFGINLAGKIDKSKVRYFRFTNIKARRFIGEARTEILKELETLKETNFKRYKEKIRDHYIIEALFYADTVEIGIDKDAAAGLDAAAILAAGNVKLTGQLTTNSEHKYVLSGSSCPFAVELVQGREF